MPYLVPSDFEVREVVEEVPLARRPSKHALVGGFEETSPIVSPIVAICVEQALKAGNMFPNLVLIGSSCVSVGTLSPSGTSLDLGGLDVSEVPSASGSSVPVFPSIKGNEVFIPPVNDSEVSTDSKSLALEREVVPAWHSCHVPYSYLPPRLTYSNGMHTTGDYSTKVARKS
ncbi:hypothetical protein CJ030_MR7G009279 [Morella rubra]|uniref:Uncharacterized protein n=1 Tax=Morella rubra TaxID=262757 RepID=A0A6A1V472_9ROSI|nr:hypothetical protein CJ030_MR7G009279 [Morella rubra]